MPIIKGKETAFNYEIESGKLCDFGQTLPISQSKLCFRVNIKRSAMIKPKIEMINCANVYKIDSSQSKFIHQVVFAPFKKYKIEN